MDSHSGKSDEEGQTLRWYFNNVTGKAKKAVWSGSFGGEGNGYRLQSQGEERSAYRGHVDRART